MKRTQPNIIVPLFFKLYKGIEISIISILLTICCMVSCGIIDFFIRFKKRNILTLQPPVYKVHFNEIIAMMIINTAVIIMVTINFFMENVGMFKRFGLKIRSKIIIATL